MLKRNGVPSNHLGSSLRAYCFMGPRRDSVLPTNIKNIFHLTSEPAKFALILFMRSHTTVVMAMNVVEMWHLCYNRADLSRVYDEYVASCLYHDKFIIYIVWFSCFCLIEIFGKINNYFESSIHVGTSTDEIQ